jgi:hypothetical protein
MIQRKSFNLLFFAFSLLLWLYNSMTAESFSSLSQINSLGFEQNLSWTCSNFSSFPITCFEAEENETVDFRGKNHDFFFGIQQEYRSTNIEGEENKEFSLNSNSVSFFCQTLPEKVSSKELLNLRIRDFGALDNYPLWKLTVLFLSIMLLCFHFAN